MNNEGTKFVDFHEYCSKCKFYNTDESDDPCDECLTNDCNSYSHKPVKFEEKN